LNRETAATRNRSAPTARNGLLGLGASLVGFALRSSPANEREVRGRRLLLEWLSETQRIQYEERNYFEVTGCHSGKRYRIRHGTGTNVYGLDDAGKPRTGWCFVPDGYLVAGDVMLAQKIALETDERGALAMANTFSLR
jgi:hypothetical protein